VSNVDKTHVKDNVASAAIEGITSLLMYTSIIRSWIMLNYIFFVVLYRIL